MVNVKSENVKAGIAKLPEILQKEWECVTGFHSTDFIKYIKKTETQVIEKTLAQVLDDFKEFWQYDSEESKVMFKEMELLSENMIREWRLKYNFTYPHVYERDDNHYSCVQRDYRLKSKVQLWEEFKEIWEIDISDYNEDKYDEMVKYISEINCDDSNYFKDYPRNFYEFRENANYHSFNSYSVLEKFEICERWEIRCQDADIEESE